MSRQILTKSYSTLFSHGRMKYGLRSIQKYKLHVPPSSISILGYSHSTFFINSQSNFRQFSHFPTRFNKLPSIPLSNKLAHHVKLMYKRVVWFSFTVLATGTLIVTGIFLYDASTYNLKPTSSHDLASQIHHYTTPRNGGPKNLPILYELPKNPHPVDPVISSDQQTFRKPRLVILGSGWGSVGLLNNLKSDEYEVVVISPSNHFCFTPLLPSAAVGTLSTRSIVEPVRRIIHRLNGYFLMGSAVDIEFSDKLVEVECHTDGDKVERMYLPYDKLVISIGSVSDSHGCKGLENCYFLKTIGNACDVRDKIIKNLELASLPHISEKERSRLLSFVICGGGPTGVEFAAELYDLLNEDLFRDFPKVLRQKISVHILQCQSHILNTYDEAVSRFVEQRFKRDSVNVLTNARVVEVLPDRVIYTQKDENKQTTLHELDAGFCLWSTGIAQAPLSKTIRDKLVNHQKNARALDTDSYLRLIGTPLGEVYAIGDCSTVQNKISEELMKFVVDVATKNGQDPAKVQLTYRDWILLAQLARKKFPQASQHLRGLDTLFRSYDHDNSGTLDLGELYELIQQIDSKLTTLPATAQRAHQQGKYLAKLFNRLAVLNGNQGYLLYSRLLEEEAYRPFEYRHLGSLAYVGNAAVFDLSKGHDWMGGLWAMYLWRSVYFIQGVSFRARLNLIMDWFYRSLFGRDLMNF